MQLGASVSTQINTRQFERGLRRALGGMSRDVKKAVQRTAMSVQAEARQRCPVDTGLLRSSIVVQMDTARSSVGYTIGSNVNYAAAVEFGTAPHVITPTNKKALYWPGAHHPVAKVNHPGTAPRPFMRPAIELTAVFFAAHVSQIRGGA